MRLYQRTRSASNTLIRKVVMEGMVKLKKITQAAAAESLGVQPSAIGNHRNRKSSEKYMNAIEAGFNAHRERLRFGKYENVESKVLEWVAKAQKLLKDSQITLSASIIRFKAADIAREMQIPNFKASRGWWDRFLKRWCLQRHVFHGEASSVDLESTTITTGIQKTTYIRVR